MTARPTIVDVARHAGVSKGLVSFALNDRPGVSPETRRRILGAAEQLGWRPSRPARQLSLQRSFALALVVRRDPRILAADPFFPHFIAGVESVLAGVGWSLLLSVVGDAAAERRTYERLAAERRADGVFLTDLRVADPRVALLAGLGLRVVVIGRPVGPVDFPTVTVDDRPGIAQAVRHLAGLGHTRIAHVSGDPRFVHGRSRREAFVTTMTDLGLDPSLLVVGDFSAASGAAATETLLATGPRPTAVVYANDPMAVAGYGVLSAAGISVPDDMSITGFDGTELGAYLHPPLSTVTTDPDGWGAAAARVLVGAFDTETSTHPHLASDPLDLPPAEFLPRGSSGPVPT